MIQKLHFDKDNIVHDIPLNEENPYFKIVNITIPEKEIEKYNENAYRFYIKHQQYREGSSVDDIINLNDVAKESTRINIKIDRIVNNGLEFKYNRIKLSYGLDEYIGFDFDLYYDTEPLDIPLDDPFKTFEEHIAVNGNSRILFSAPYGAGKTTFLKDFFRKTEDEFEVIYLFPVNYSVARNEDIFKYIKCGILFQLLGKDVEFKKEEFKYLQTLPQYILQNPIKILAPFVELLPKIGRSAFEILQKLGDLRKSFLEFHNEAQVDKKEEAERYIEKIYDEEGSIYEDNFYTQLIRELIEQLNSKGKKTVLVIDDMDRMDPDHIFRVLNVFAAHFDSEDYDFGNSNKFGLKKIVFVCDIQNIKRLFHYRYGDSVDFAGYIDKFFSNSIYRFSNTYAIQQFIESIRMISPENSQLQIFLIILQDLYATGNLSLREILKLRKVDFFAFRIANQPESKKDISRFENFRLHYYPHIYYLNLIFSFEEIIEKLLKCSELIPIDPLRNFSQIFEYALVSVIGTPVEEEKLYSYKYNGETIKYKLFWNPNFENGFFYKVDLEDKTLKFSIKDFYIILAEVVKKYQLVGGLYQKG